jgi:hypothetical protein
MERPLAARRAKEISVINESLIANDSSSDEAGEVIEKELKEKLKENAQRRKEIEEKVILCTEEFDRQQSSNSPSDPVGESVSEGTTEKADEVKDEETKEEDTLCVPDLALESPVLTQTQLKDIIRAVLLVFCAIICGNPPRT